MRRADMPVEWVGRRTSGTGRDGIGTLGLTHSPSFQTMGFSTVHLAGVSIRRGLRMERPPTSDTSTGTTTSDPHTVRIMADPLTGTPDTQGTLLEATSVTVECAEQAVLVAVVLAAAGWLAVSTAEAVVFMLAEAAFMAAEAVDIAAREKHARRSLPGRQGQESRIPGMADAALTLYSQNRGRSPRYSIGRSKI